MTSKDDLGRTVEWLGNRYEIVGIFHGPSYTLKREGGDPSKTLTVGAQVVKFVPKEPEEKLSPLEELEKFHRLSNTSSLALSENEMEWLRRTPLRALWLKSGTDSVGTIIKWLKEKK